MARTDRNLLWVWGGGLLIAATVLTFVPQYGALGWTRTGGVLLSAAAWVLFAVGAGRAVETAIARVALFVLALWPFVGMVAWPLLTAGMTGAGDVPDWMPVVGTVDQLVPAVAALVAALDIWRGTRVPAALRRLPMLALALCVVRSVLTVVISTAVGVGDPAFLIALNDLSTLCRIVASVGLGVVAIVAGLRARPDERAVRVYPPEAPAP
mgnify:CR=1 FL=1